MSVIFDFLMVINFSAIVFALCFMYSTKPNNNDFYRIYVKYNVKRFLQTFNSNIKDYIFFKIAYIPNNESRYIGIVYNWFKL